MLPVHDNEIYYDITIRGNTGGTELVRADFREVRNEAILKKPYLYDIGIVRFECPSNNIPLSFWPGDDVLYVWLSWNGYTTPQFPVLYIPNHTNDSPYGSQYKPIFFQAQFDRCVNAAYKLAYTNLFNHDNSVPVTQAPFLEYDTATEIVSLHAQIEYDTSISTNPKIYMNGPLYRYYAGLESFTYADESVNLLVYLKFNNKTSFVGIPYYTMESQFSGQADFFNQIIIQTSGVPVINELKAVGNNQTSLVTSVLTDFNFPNGNRALGKLIYYNQANIRWYSLRSHSELTAFDLRFLWSSDDGSVFPLLISPRVAANVKVCFRLSKNISG
jgi:hypothetical protein